MSKCVLLGVSLLSFILMTGCDRGLANQATVLDEPVSLDGVEYHLNWTDNKKFVIENCCYEYDCNCEGKMTVNICLTEHISYGDLNSDGLCDAVVVLAVDSGGSGTFYEMIVLMNINGKLLQTSSNFLGDRVTLESLKIDSGTIFVDIITHGSEDPMFNPTQRTLKAFKLDRYLNLVCARNT